MRKSLRARLHDARGQSVVEFALAAPLLIFLLVGIVDLARIYTTMLSVESAAREAADFGTFGSQKWASSAVDAPDGTVPKMVRRACTAASDLPDYAEPAGTVDHATCTNPSFSYELSTDRGATWTAYDPSLACDDPSREPPCYVRVTLQYDFALLVPLHIELLGVELGLPDQLSFERSSVYAMTDLELEP